MIAAHSRDIRLSESCRWFPVSAPRPIMNGLCTTRAYLRAPSGETTSSTASPADGVGIASDILVPGLSQAPDCNTPQPASHGRASTSHVLRLAPPTPQVSALPGGKHQFR